MNSDQTRPRILVELGVNAQSRPDISTLLARAQAQLELAAAGQQGLAFLKVPAAVLKSPVHLDEGGNYSLAVEIPPDVQKSIVEFPTRSRGRLVNLARDRDEEQHTDKVVALVQSSAGLVQTVAGILSTSANPHAEIRLFEKSSGLDTAPARRFLYSAQDDFTLDIDGSVIPFENKTIRARVQVSQAVKLTVKLDADTLLPIAKGTIVAVEGQDGQEPLFVGMKRSFNFQQMDSPSLFLLTAAKEFGLTVKLVASMEVSTCTLNYRPHDVSELNNFREILTHTLDILHRISRTHNVPPPDQHPDLQVVIQ